MSASRTLPRARRCESCRAAAVRPPLPRRLHRAVGAVARRRGAGAARLPLPQLQSDGRAAAFCERCSHLPRLDRNPPVAPGLSVRALCPSPVTPRAPSFLALSRSDAPGRSSERPAACCSAALCAARGCLDCCRCAAGRSRCLTSHGRSRRPPRGQRPVAAEEAHLQCAAWRDGVPGVARRKLARVLLLPRLPIPGCGHQKGGRDGRAYDTGLPEVLHRRHPRRWARLNVQHTLPIR